MLISMLIMLTGVATMLASLYSCYGKLRVDTVNCGLGILRWQVHLIDIANIRCNPVNKYLVEVQIEGGLWTLAPVSDARVRILHFRSILQITGTKSE